MKTLLMLTSYCQPLIFTRAKITVFLSFISPLFLLAILGFVPSATAPVEPEPIRLYRLDCGKIDFKDLSFFSDTGDYDGKGGELVVPCYLIKHPKGWLMWDTGLSNSLIGKPEVNMLGATETVSSSIESQLKAIGITFKDINFVSFSHSHADHTGNAELFKDATWILQKRELEYASAKPTPGGIKPEYVSLLNSVKKTQIDGDYDVFGDGRVKLLFVPGHTPGHQAISIKLEKSGTYILAGDLYHMDYSREHQLVPIFNYNRAETLASIHRIEALAKVRKAKVITQHEPKDEKLFPILPKYLD